MKNNPLLCDAESGICELPSAPGESAGATVEPGIKPVKIIYFTDPICSTCWGIEPQLRKLKLEYGPLVELEYRMGGLLPDWSYNSGGISKPTDVAPHWDEVSRYYEMPIVGDVWLEDPLHSSYPPSVAFKAAQMQDEGKALAFLRRIREMVFLEKKNITRWEHLADAASHAGLDVGQFEKDYQTDAVKLFQGDLQLAAQWAVRGFPTLLVFNREGQHEKIYGFKPYEIFEAAIAKMHPGAPKGWYSKNWQDLFAQYPTLTTKEFAGLSGQSFANSEQHLGSLHKQGLLHAYTTVNGTLWKNIAF
ncbi:Predicted dithiol-disulfide isomerase, DsbA family [Dyadobacter soli]|uniref:Predicted dithiol-disulfide isomerase, DsbA family n=1 Tax=Dyadobacter soli TaxID=659014 RepID=A0A1G7FU38_9BACT|nr:ClpXP adapter SpxH family protein [Dyadobacter soli]SDE79433.1 Predicted dithiol-disulfide isomerase, DsbA family [Dyadobacter soli]